MKSFERDELIREEGREEGRNEMQAELDRTKAEAAEKDKRIEALEKQLAELRKMAGSAANTHMTYEPEQS